MLDFAVIQVDPTTRKVTINPGMVPKKLSGIDKLIQIVVLAILNDPGRDVMNPETGSGLPGLIGSNISSSDPTEIIADITERLEKIKEEILAFQSNLINETPSERLRDLRVLNISQGTQIDEIIVKLRLISEAGDETTLVL